MPGGAIWTRPADGWRSPSRMSIGTRSRRSSTIAPSRRSCSWSRASRERHYDPPSSRSRVEAPSGSGRSRTLSTPHWRQPSSSGIRRRSTGFCHHRAGAPRSADSSIAGGRRPLRGTAGDAASRTWRWPRRVPSRGSILREIGSRLLRRVVLLEHAEWLAAGGPCRRGSAARRRGSRAIRAATCHAVSRATRPASSRRYGACGLSHSAHACS